MVINSYNISKIKESLNSDGHQFLQYQQNELVFTLSKIKQVIFWYFYII
jgi:hypothetical protein